MNDEALDTHHEASSPPLKTSRARPSCKKLYGCAGAH